MQYVSQSATQGFAASTFFVEDYGTPVINAYTTDNLEEHGELHLTHLCWADLQDLNWDLALPLGRLGSGR